jgi:TfoX/Sxy family transcriptional regulator of competence genes
MAWKKIPKEHHPLFLEALPKSRKVKSIKMFGGMCGTVNGNMFTGLWADSVMVRLEEKDRKKVLAMQGSSPFDPMGKGKPTKEMVVLPDKVMTQKARLKTWVKKAFDYTATLPPKKKKPKKGARK